MERKGYKVVRLREDGNLCSAMRLEVHGGVRYSIGKATKPRRRGGPLGVFESLEDAKHFVKQLVSAPTRIYECKYRPSKFKYFWSWCGPKILGCSFPKGTRFADEVTLLKEVNQDEET